MKGQNMGNEVMRTKRNSEDEKIRRLEVKKKPYRPLSFLTTCLPVLLMTIALTACGGGGGGGETGGSASSDSTTTFSGSTPGTNAVYMSKNSELSNGNIIAIDVKANNISENAYGAAFDVDFDSSAMTYHSYEAGNFFESRGDTANYMAALDSGSSGKLIVGISTLGTATGVSGSGTLMTLMFDVTGDSSVSFSNNSLKDSSNQAISGLAWYDGAVYLD